MRKITSKNYVKSCCVTESRDFKTIQKRLSKKSVIRLLHGALGLCTEAGEFQDMLKKHLFYGKKLDLVNLMEEISDSCWYIGLIIDELTRLKAVKSFDEVLSLNIEKLANRYPEKFKEFDALNRNLEKERAILERRKS